LDDLGADWNLRLNKRKSQIITRENQHEVNGIECVSGSKYLGVKLSIDRKSQDHSIRSAIKTTLPYIARKLRHLDPSLKEHLICTLARSLLIYHGTPMVAAGLWKQSDIQQLECQLYREGSALSN